MDSRLPPGYQTISGEWVALTPELQLLTSPQEAAETTVGEEDGNMKTGGREGPYQDRTLFRWAKYHREQFRQRIAEQNLGPFALSIISGKSLQEGSMTQEYCEFLKAFRKARAKATHKSGYISPSFLF